YQESHGGRMEPGALSKDPRGAFAEHSTWVQSRRTYRLRISTTIGRREVAAEKILGEGRAQVAEDLSSKASAWNGGSSGNREVDISTVSANRELLKNRTRTQSKGSAVQNRPPVEC